MNEREGMQDVHYGHAQYTVMNLSNKDSMANVELEEAENNLAKLVLEKEDFELIQFKYKSYSHALKLLALFTLYRKWVLA